MNDSAIDTAVSLLSNEIKSLKEYCLQAIEEKVTGIHIENALKILTKDQHDTLVDLLPLNTPLTATVPTILDEAYWKRKCIADNWNYVHFWINNCSWREAFICHYVEEAVDNFLAKKITFTELEHDLKVFIGPLKRVKINGYRGNITEEKKENDSESLNDSFEENTGKLLASFPNLEEVYLNIAPAEYAIRNETEGTVKGQKLIKDIFSLKCLTKLSIIGFSLKESEISILAECLLDSIVNYLNLSCNLLTDESCDSLANVLKSSHLHTLVVNNNCIGCNGVEKILLGLHGNETLLSLDLSKNYIGDEGGVKIAEHLKSNCVLNKLDISFNKMGYNSGLVFNAVIRSNSGLLCLNLSGNSMGKEVGKMFAEAIAINKSLRYFGIEFCGFAEQEEDSIYTIIHRNRNKTDSGIFL